MESKLFFKNSILSLVKIVTLPLVVFVLSACQQGYQFDLPQTSSTFLQSITYNNKIDVVLVVDDSTGMTDYVSKLQARIPSFINALLQQKLDLHVGIVTTTMGGTGATGGMLFGSPKYLTSNTSDLAGQVNARLAAIGAAGSNLERGLDSLTTILSTSYRNGEGAGFLRDDALLAVIAISTEDDKSSTLGSSVTPYRNFLDQVKGFYKDGTRMWTMNFIGILALGGTCTTNTTTNYQEPGVRWMSLADSSNGIKESICAADFSYAASNIRQRIAHILTDFRLDKIPDLATLKVFINDVEIPNNPTNGYSYLSASNVVRFNGTAVPAADAKIFIDFKPAGAN